MLRSAQLTHRRFRFSTRGTAVRQPRAWSPVFKRATSIGPTNPLLPRTSPPIVPSEHRKHEARLTTYQRLKQRQRRSKMSDQEFRKQQPTDPPKPEEKKPVTQPDVPVPCRANSKSPAP